MSAQDFYLSELSFDATASLATVAGSNTSAFTGEVNAEFDVSLSVVKDMFRFHTDSSDADIVVADDLNFCVVHTAVGAPMSSNFLDYTECIAGGSGSIMNSAAVHPENIVTYDYVSYLAYSIFGTQNSVDLISNAPSLRTELDSEAKSQLDTTLVGLADQNWLDASDNSNPSYKIVSQILFNDRNRLNSSALANLYIPTPLNGLQSYSCPLSPGDAIYFLMKVVADPTQKASIGIGSGSIADRTYLIKANVVAS